MVAVQQRGPYRSPVITGAQIRAARAMLGWTRDRLSQASGVATVSIKNIEAGKSDPRASTLEAIEKALGKAGVIFLEDGVTREGGPGIRMKLE